MPRLPSAFRLAPMAWACGSAACEPVLDVGTWLGTPPAATPTSPATEPTAPPDEPEPEPPSDDSGLPAVDSGLAAKDAGPFVDSGLGSVDSGPPDAGGHDGPPDSGVGCTFPSDIDLNAPAEPREWTTPIAVPWSTGFENGFCDFAIESGYCYADTDSTFDIVMAPRRSGGAAAAFSVATADEVSGTQARCVRRGILPAEAYYGAWYFIPKEAQTAANWNLFHFLGGDGADRKGLWDVSIRSTPDGRLFLYIRDFFAAVVYEPENAPPLPIGQWVHVQFYLRRAADTTGEIALYQDGQRLYRLNDVVTDDTEQGAWYLGNLADDLTPSELTIFMDDVTIGDSL